MRILTFISLLGILLLPFHSSASKPLAYAEYAKKEFVSSGNVRLPYRIMAPQKETDSGKYPLVVFLHGSGERGNDNAKQLLHGASVFSNPVNADKYPAYVVFPQCKEKFWTENINERMFMPGSPVPAMSKIETGLIELIDDIVSSNPIDPERIYIVGISMGGIAAYDLACRFPGKFAAAVPICGAVNPDRLPSAKDVNFMIFHGEEDDEVPSFCSREAYKTLNAAGANVEYVEFSGVGHECWDSAFNYVGFLPWLFSQARNASENEDVADNLMK